MVCFGVCCILSTVEGVLLIIILQSASSSFALSSGDFPTLGSERSSEANLQQGTATVIIFLFLCSCLTPEFVYIIANKILSLMIFTCACKYLPWNSLLNIMSSVGFVFDIELWYVLLNLLIDFFLIRKEKQVACQCSNIKNDEETTLLFEFNFPMELWLAKK